MSLDFEKFIEQNCLMLIRIELNDLPGKLEKLVDKSYEFSTTEYNSLKKEQKDFYERLKKKPDISGVDENGNPFSYNEYLESNAEDYFMEQGSVIETYTIAMHSMLINFMYETYTNLKKHIGDSLKSIEKETASLNRIFDDVYKTSGIEKVNLINNCIKHTDCTVSKELSDNYPDEFVKDKKIELNEEMTYELLKITQSALRLVEKKFNKYY